MFRNSAHIYDAVYRHIDHAGQAQKIIALVAAEKPDAATLLDVACGTGLHLESFKDHFAVEGVDIDPGMLAVASNRLPGVPLHEASMLDFSLGKTFDVLTCLFSSIGYAGSVEGTERAIGTMAAHLNPGGVLVVHAWLRPEDWEDGHLSADLVDEPDLKIARLIRTYREGRVTTLEAQHLVVTQEGFEHIVDNHTMFMLTDDEYLAAFTKAGLSTRKEPEPLLGRGLFVGLKPAE